MCRIF